MRQAGCELPDPEGGFYLFPDLSVIRDQLARRGIHNDRQLCARLLEETGVAALPGSDFGRPARELTLRLAYANFDGGEALSGAAAFDARQSALDDEFLNTYGAPVMEGVERLASWIEDW